MYTGNLLPSAIDVESTLNYETLQQCLENAFSSPDPTALLRAKPTRSRDDEEVQCLYNKSHRKRHSESPSYDRPPPGQYQYIMLKNPPVEVKRNHQFGDGMLPGWMLRKRKSQPEMAVSSVQQPLPSISSPIAQHSYLSDTTNSSTTDSNNLQNLHKNPSYPISNSQNQSQPMKQQHRYYQDTPQSPTRLSMETSNSDGFEYVILRVPSKMRSAAHDNPGYYAQNGTSSNGAHIIAKKLSTEDALNLVAAIRAMKVPPSGPIVQVAKTPSPHQNYLSSPNWMQDNSGKYEYL
jgi:hypothetical protein